MSYFHYILEYNIGMSLKVISFENVFLTDLYFLIEEYFWFDSLQQLNLTNCKEFTDNHLKYIVEECHNIQQLNLRNCSITDTGLKYLAEGCHNIQQLNLSSWEPKFTENGLKYITERCHNIQQ